MATLEGLVALEASSLLHSHVSLNNRVVSEKSVIRHHVIIIASSTSTDLAGAAYYIPRLYGIRLQNHGVHAVCHCPTHRYVMHDCIWNRSDREGCW